jgi:hypothetical protein
MANATAGTTLEARPKKHKGLKTLRPEATFTVSITVRNESSDVAASGTVTLRNQRSSEIHTVGFGRIVPGGFASGSAQFEGGFPDMVVSHFADETHPGDDWNTFNVNPSGGYSSVDIHLSN